uniref:Acid phosphatase 1 n=2 Tax=Aegilops tauschii subsp. strangulata TaxID=200361 RepID=A0A453ANT2_AEGTS
MAALDLRRWLMVLLVGLLAAFQVADGAPWFWPPGGDDPDGCLSWRVMVEANNAKFWRAVPAPCIGYVWAYMSWGQYGRDVSSAADQIAAYASQAPAAGDGLDAWVLDIDDTCLSNLPYYQAKQFGAYDPAAFKAWASRGACPGIPAMVRLFWALKGGGFRVFLLSGRDEEALGASTAANLAAAGFAGYDRLILRYDMTRVMYDYFFLVQLCTTTSFFLGILRLDRLIQSTQPNISTQPAEFTEWSRLLAHGA